MDSDDLTQKQSMVDDQQVAPARGLTKVSLLSSSLPIQTGGILLDHDLKWKPAGPMSRVYIRPLALCPPNACRSLRKNKPSLLEIHTLRSPVEGL